MGKRLAVAPDRGQKPAEAEGLRVVPFATETADDQNDDRVDLFKQFLSGKLAEELRDGVDDAAFACRPARDQDRERTVVEPQDRRRRNAEKPLRPNAAHDPRL